MSAPNMGIYNASKHAVVAISETLYQDLALVTEQVHAHVLCPFYVPTAISSSGRNRPGELTDDAAPTPSQGVAQALSARAVSRGKVSAAAVAQFVFDAMAQRRFYIFSHPNSLSSVQTRLEDIMTHRNPSDPFKERPDVRRELVASLKQA